MKTVKHFHWNMPGPMRLFGGGFWLAVGVSMGLDVARAIRSLGEMLAGFVA